MLEVEGKLLHVMMTDYHHPPAPSPTTRSITFAIITNNACKMIFCLLAVDWRKIYIKMHVRNGWRILVLKSVFVLSSSNISDFFHASSPFPFPLGLDSHYMRILCGVYFQRKEAHYAEGIQSEYYCVRMYNKKPTVKMFFLISSAID